MPTKSHRWDKTSPTINGLHIQFIKVDMDDPSSVENAKHQIARTINFPSTPDARSTTTWAPNARTQGSRPPCISLGQMERPWWGPITLIDTSSSGHTVWHMNWEGMPKVPRDYVLCIHPHPSSYFLQTILYVCVTILYMRPTKGNPLSSGCM